MPEPNSNHAPIVPALTSVLLTNTERRVAARAVLLMGEIATGLDPSADAHIDLAKRLMPPFEDDDLMHGAFDA